MRTNLNVPYVEKDQAKRCGARWDAALKTWYVEDLENLKPFLRWMPPHLRRATGRPLKKHLKNDPRADCREAVGNEADHLRSILKEK